MDYVSKIVKLNSNVSGLYALFADFRNLVRLVPPDKVADLEATEDECSFTVKPIGRAGLRIVDREQDKTVKYATDSKSHGDFMLWVQLKPATPQETYLRITLRAKLNILLRNLVGGKLQKGLDDFVDKLAEGMNGAR
ncbi:MAG: hypothetical protein LBS94_04890 [Prevotellaceae bacterium]|jgi:hypothetical protein|nr:hypothetical protein [Prevotellaceae bacterium]